VHSGKHIFARKYSGEEMAGWKKCWLQHVFEKWQSGNNAGCSMCFVRAL
jgi:hypothetical protein